MTKRARQAMVGGGVVAAAVVGVAGLAFACTASANLRIGKVIPAPGVSGGHSEPAVAPGSTVGLVGEWFRDGSPVEIHWDSPAGPELATLAGPAFAVTVTVPPADAGVHAIVAVQHAPAAAGDGAGDVVQRAVAVAVHAPGAQPVAGSASRLYAPGEAPGLGPSLSPDPSSSVAWAVGLVGAGLVALGAGSLLAASRRRAPLAAARRSG